ncbi:MAG: type 4a pilus biogenesis protein PilO [Desulfocapsaceae bacterium]|nr:type 4a pilus biogenesis protein PilO [Desulfocapsaceae bacterium]
MAKISSVITWYNQRPLRERILLLLAVSAVVLYGSYLLLLQPLGRRTESARQEIVQMQTRQLELQALTQTVEARKNVDPDRQNRQKLAILEKEIAEMQQDLQAGLENLVSPAEMPALLKDLLTQEKKLRLLSLENKAPERIVLGNVDTSESASAIVYRHPLRMKFSGDYMTLLAYLRQLEELPRTLVWEKVDIATDNYPEATVNLEVYTLSLKEGWIGG